MKLQYLLALAATVTAAPAPLNTYRNIGELINGFTWSTDAVTDNEADNWIKDAAATRAMPLRYWDAADLTSVTAAFTALDLTATTPETIDVAADDDKWKDTRANSPLQWSANEAGVFAWNPQDTTGDLSTLFGGASVEYGWIFDEINISPLPRQDGQGNSMAGAALRGMVDTSIGAIDPTRDDANLNRNNADLDRFAGENVNRFWTQTVTGSDTDTYPAFLIQLPRNARPKIDQYRLRVKCSAYTWAPITTDLTPALTNTAFLYQDIGTPPVATIQSRIIGAVSTPPTANAIKKTLSYYREFVIQVVQSSDMKDEVDVQRGKYAPQNFFTWSPCGTPDKADCMPTDA